MTASPMPSSCLLYTSDATDAIFEEFKQMFADDYNFADGDEGDDSMFTDAE